MMGAENEFDSTLTKIKSRGYWKIDVYPNFEPPLNNEKPGNLKERIRLSSVEFRGWSFPQIPNVNSNRRTVFTAGDKIQGWVNIPSHLEIWRFSNNWQFIDFLALHEDWFKEDEFLNEDDFRRKIIPETILDPIWTLYSLTEAFVFIKNLYSEIFIDTDQLNIKISLFKTRGRKLRILNPNRTPLSLEYVCHNDNIDFDFLKKTYQIKIIKERFLELALTYANIIFSQFNWENIPQSVLQEAQKRLIERRLD